jgi:hypothetical protein
VLRVLRRAVSSSRTVPRAPASTHADQSRNRAELQIRHTGTDSLASPRPAPTDGSASPGVNAVEQGPLRRGCRQQDVHARPNVTARRSVAAAARGERGGHGDPAASEPVPVALLNGCRSPIRGGTLTDDPGCANLVGHLLVWVTGRCVRRCARATGRRDPRGGRTPRSFRRAPRAATSVLHRFRADSRDRCR